MHTDRGLPFYVTLMILHCVGRRVRPLTRAELWDVAAQLERLRTREQLARVPAHQADDVYQLAALDPRRH